MTIDEYEDGGRALYTEFAAAVAGILRAAIGEHVELRLQSIQHRAKDPTSLRVKLAKAGAAPDAGIADVAKDVAGCRVIFYTNGDVHRFGQSRILGENFQIDFDRSKIHYPANTEDGAEFFISENWVVQLSEARCTLPEYRRFAGLICEVQVQTVLDHAWAEMAHDTIYKPMADAGNGFGVEAVDAMRGRLRKVMRDYLQPAGYEFDKIASDFAKLREGRAMFDEDALAIIRDCADRNCLSDAIERFENYVLPNYANYIAAAPEIIDTLADAVVRAIVMPDVPREAYFGDFPGVTPEAIIAQICSVLESGYLLYAEPNRMFDALIRMRGAAKTEEQQKPVDNLTRRFAQHDRRAWQQVGPGLQRLVVDRMAALDDNEVVDAAPTLIPMLKEALSSTVSGTSWNGDTVTLHSGAVSAGEALKRMRRDAIGQLKRLHAVAGDEETRAAARSAMMAAGHTPNNAGYSDELGVVIINDLTEVVGFLTEVAPSLGLEPKRRLEAQLFRVYYTYRTLPPAMAENPDLVTAQERLLIAIAKCRAVIDADEDLARYRTLVGHDSVSRRQWLEGTYDFRADAEENAARIDEMAAHVSPSTEAEWLDRLERYAQTQSRDLATFLGLDQFIKKVAETQPAILLGWLPRLSDRLAQRLPGMLHGLADAGQGAAIDALIEEWVADGRHLSSIAWYLQFAKSFRVDLLMAILGQSLAAADVHTLSNVAHAVVRQSVNHPDGLFDKVYLPAARALTAHENFSWAGGMFNWDQMGLLKGLTPSQVEDLLGLVASVPRLETDGEAMLAVLAQEHVQAVLNLIGARFRRQRKAFDTRYEDLPYGLAYLHKPLAAAPAELISAARTWYDEEPQLAQFRGGRLIAEVFPTLDEPVGDLLLAHVGQGRQGVDFVLSVLRAYEGQPFLHPLLREIVDVLEPDDELLGIVRIVIESSGVLVGEYGSVEALESRKALVAEWTRDKRPKVREFAASFIKSADNALASERRRADRSVAMRKIGGGWD